MGGPGSGRKKGSSSKYTPEQLLKQKAYMKELKKQKIKNNCGL